VERLAPGRRPAMQSAWKQQGRLRGRPRPPDRALSNDTADEHHAEGEAVLVHADDGPRADDET
jgi:hypothetical protein